MPSIALNCNECAVEPNILSIYRHQEEDDDNMIDDNIICNQDSENSLRLVTDVEEVCFPENSDSSNLSQPSERTVSGNELQLKDFTVEFTNKNEIITNEKGQLVRVSLSNGKTMIVKKKSLVWFFNEDRKRISTDRLIRVKDSKSGKSYNKTLNESEKEWKINIEKEKYYSVYYDEQWYLGRITEILTNSTNKISEAGVLEIFLAYIHRFPGCRRKLYYTGCL